uniref:Transthyretin/hydroxyisourate hydrolase domain-containing protein n=1 Tax=Oncorhynchus mykiss TaxID=8022 RepID=A0A8C7RDW9_ONCMY
YKSTLLASPYCPLTTHVLNTGMGVPGAHVALSMHRMDPSTSIWNLLTTGTTTDDGRCPGLITRENITPAFLPILVTNTSVVCVYLQIVFTITDHSQKFHVPLLCSRFSYTTYRGS